MDAPETTPTTAAPEKTPTAPATQAEAVASGNGLVRWWRRFAENHVTLSQFLVFFVLSNVITVLQLTLMPLAKWVFGFTPLVDQAFQVGAIGSNVDGSQYYVFDYAAGALSQGGGGLAYFLAVQITILIAQVINFFAQRSVTFKSNSSIWRAAFWYAIAYVIITLVAAAAQGFYKTPIYGLLMDSWGLGGLGETLADVITMIINAAISFWVFFPIFKVIFKQVPEEDATDGAEAPASCPLAPVVHRTARAVLVAACPCEDRRISRRRARGTEWPWGVVGRCAVCSVRWARSCSGASCPGAGPRRRTSGRTCALPPRRWRAWIPSRRRWTAAASSRPGSAGSSRSTRPTALSCCGSMTRLSAPSCGASRRPGTAST